VPGCNELKVSTSHHNKFHHNTMGVSPDNEVKPNGVDFWWDSFPLNRGNCWWSNTAAPGKAVTSSPARLPNCLGGRFPALSVGTGALLNEVELVACFAGFTLGPYPAGNDLLCSWTKTPPQPGGQSTALKVDTTAQKKGLAAICANGLATRLCAPYKAGLQALAGTSSLKSAPDPFAGVKASSSEGPLGSFTCSWWRRADAAHRLGIVQRIQRFATGRIDGTKALGFGASMSDAQTAGLFESRCSTFQTGPFALYKLYGAAAPFAAMTK
jgi:hypothetical protein